MYAIIWKLKKLANWATLLPSHGEFIYKKTPQSKLNVCRQHLNAGPTVFQGKKSIIEVTNNVHI